MKFKELKENDIVYYTPGFETKFDNFTIYRLKIKSVEQDGPYYVFYFYPNDHLEVEQIPFDEAAETLFDGSYKKRIYRDFETFYYHLSTDLNTLKRFIENERKNLIAEKEAELKLLKKSIDVK